MMVGDLNILFVAVGALALVVGLTMLGIALRRHKLDHRADSPGGVAMLIAGMMATAFGLLMAGFAIAYAMSDPLDLNAEAAR